MRKPQKDRLRSAPGRVPMRVRTTAQPGGSRSHDTSSHQRRAILLFLRPFAPYRQLLRPLLTPRSVSPRRPFGHEARAPQVRTRSRPAPPPDLPRLSLDHYRFAVHCPLALLGIASDPVRVPRRAVSLRASFPRALALARLRFASLAVVYSRADLHLQDRAHARRTMKKPPTGGL